MQTVVMVYLHLRLVELDSIAIVWMIAIILYKRKGIFQKWVLCTFSIPTYWTGNNPNRPSSYRNRSTNSAFSLGTIAGEPNNFRACSHDMSHVVLIPSKFCVPRSPSLTSLGPPMMKMKEIGPWSLTPVWTRQCFAQSTISCIYLWLLFIFWQTSRRSNLVTKFYWAERCYHEKSMT